MKYNKIPAEALILVWLQETGAKQFTHRQVERECSPYWEARGRGFTAITWIRAAQRIRQHGYLGKVDDQEKVAGATIFKFNRAELKKGLARFKGAPERTTRKGKRNA